MAALQAEFISPEWLDSKYVEKIIKKEDPDFLVKNISVSMASTKGDNYASVMLRITVDVEKENEKNPQKRSFLIKCLEEGVLGKFFTENGMFGREILMYRDTIPLITELFQYYLPNSQVAPKTVFCKRNDIEMLIMEDLNQYGFKTQNRRLGLDLEHAIEVMKKLGQFHAASAILELRHPNIFDAYREHSFYSNEMEALFSSLIRSLALEVEYWPDQKHLRPKLEKLANEFVERGKKALEFEDDDFVVLTHGDLWISNILFNYSNSNAIENVIFVDYQLVCYTSPVLDLHYLFNTSLNDTVRQKHRNLLIEVYHSSLCDHLKIMGYPKEPPKLSYLQQEFRKRAVLGCLNSCCNFPLARAEASDNFKMENKINKNEQVNKREKIFSKEITKKELKKRLLEFEDLQVFE